jgi:hypothetical protein
MSSWKAGAKPVSGTSGFARLKSLMRRAYACNNSITVIANRRPSMSHSVISSVLHRLPSIYRERIQE